MAVSKLKLSMKPFDNFVAANKLFVRSASAKEMEFVTHLAIREGWHVGLYDFPCGHGFDPKGFLVGEVDGQTVCHISAVSYPNHHSHMGGSFVVEGHRGNGYGMKLMHTAYNCLDKNYTIGFDVDLETMLKHEKFNGFQTCSLEDLYTER